jgi:hypothetical protein
MQKSNSQSVKMLICAFALIWAGTSFAATAPQKQSNTITLYRCTDVKGKVSLQDSPCAKTSKQETREMIRFSDAPPAKKNIASKPAAIAQPVPIQNPVDIITAPPALYQCTNYEGKVRDSENYDPNPRCEPLWALGYHVDYLPLEQRARYCRWIEDSCVRYEGKALCDRWRSKQKQAQSDVRYAFSDTLSYRKSELARITQIVNTSCR